jgi:hypothetical protein
VLCPICKTRKARRQCPALQQQICAICCGTKRVVEIDCPAGCGYLAAAREHPAAIVVRRQQRDLAHFFHGLRDLNDGQTRLFVALASIIAGYQPPDLHTLIDDDVAEAAATLAATFETATRGVIYEHRAASLPAERLAAALKPLLADAGKAGGTPFERDAAVVLRRLAESARVAHDAAPANRRAYLDLLSRVMITAGEPPASAASDESPHPGRLIVP